MASNVVTGKAFEYATLAAFRHMLQKLGVDVAVEKSPALDTAKQAYLDLGDAARADYRDAALAGAAMVVPLEPGLFVCDAADPLHVGIQADARGQAGDVRDVVFSRPGRGWEVGVSCKHNHEALKHPRVTEGADFGADWIGVPCSGDFLGRIAAVMQTVRLWESQKTKWRDHDDKQDVVYVPVVDAFADEIRRLCAEEREAPARLVRYFFGTNDFYKVIAQDRRQPGDAGITRVLPFNMGGTLGRQLGDARPLYQLPRTMLPSRLIEVRRCEGSKTTLQMIFDRGWAVSMRLHSADSRVKRTGLKWDVQLVGMPHDVQPQVRPWGSPCAAWAGKLS